ncbi:S-adenosyl-L-methionine-dependent methyltransferase [Aspergillus leporis]|uniref:Velvet complex subunit laeA n=1 Tax=Aspergillus leporis TaxID=41062 RepID=A0A5N5WN00_9EURO|nr:S-adenosyl-L-methionine-dependent methyltransferase [Aspergillus leporis]
MDPVVYSYLKPYSRKYNCLLGSPSRNSKIRGRPLLSGAASKFGFDLSKVHQNTSRNPSLPTFQYICEALSRDVVATESKPNHDFYFENQRMYHGYRKGVYMVPCDEQEQERLDFLHKAFSLAIRSNRLIHVPHPTSAKILGLGCGTGLWAIDLAERNPGASIVGVDLSLIQPSNHPLNYVIHLWMGCGSVASWHSLYRRVLTHLRRGAWFEQVEIDFEPQFANWALKESHLQYWYQNLKLATEPSMRPLAHHSEETLNKLQEVGFIEIRHHQFRLPLSPWHQDEQERLVGRWYGLVFLQSMEPLSLAPFSRILGWSTDRIHQLLFNTKSEIFNN